MGKKKKTKHKKTKKRSAGVAKSQKTTSNKETASALKKAEPPIVSPYPEAGQKVTDFEAKLDAALSETGEVKRGRGRPRKETTGELEQIGIDETIVAQVVQIPFDLWAFSQNCDRLKIDLKEAKLISKPLKQLLDYYMPSVPEIAWAWIAFSTASYTIVKSRLVIIAEIKKAQSPNISSAKAGVVNTENVAGQGGPGPLSTEFPTLEQIKKPVT